MDQQFDTYDPPRRRRNVRTGKGKKPKMTPRVIEVFKILARYRYLRTEQIRQLLPEELRGKSYTRFSEILGRLYDHYYLDRPEAQEDNKNFYHAQAIHALDKRGYKELDQRAIEEPYYNLTARSRLGAEQEFEHALMGIDATFAIERGVATDPLVSFASWGEVMQAAPEETWNSPNPFRLPKVHIEHQIKGRLHETVTSLIPDGLVLLTYRHGDVLYIIECERGNPVTRTNLEDNSTLKKVLTYRELRRLNLFEGHFGVRAVVVLIVQTDEARVRSTLGMLLDVTKGQGSTMFAVTHIPVFGSTRQANPPIPDLYRLPWKRAGHPDFYLNDPK